MPVIVVLVNLCVEVLVLIMILMSCVQAGRERQRFDFDDFDTAPQKFNI